MMEILIDSAYGASYDDFSQVLKLNLGNGVSVRITESALTQIRETLPGGDTDLSDLESAIGDLRSKLEDAQSEINSKLADAESEMADAQSNIEDARSAADCHSEAAEALAEVERQMEHLNS